MTPHPTRIVLAEDSVLLREGLVRLLTDAGFDVVEAVADAESFLRAVEVAAARPRASSTCACRRRSPTRACAPRSSSGSSTRTIAVVVLSRVRRGELRHRAARGPGARRRVPVEGPGRRRRRVRRTPCGGWPAGGTALDPEVVSQLLSRGTAPRPARAAEPARDRGAAADGRGAVEHGHRGGPGRERGRRREARLAASSPSSTCHRPSTTTAACSPCCAGSSTAPTPRRTSERDEQPHHRRVDLPSARPPGAGSSPSA